MNVPPSLQRISAGFPSPADDWVERILDLNDLLVPHPVSTFFAQVEGDSMIDAGIHAGDILVVDKELEAAHGHIVIAVLNGSFTLKRLQVNGETRLLKAENPAYPRSKWPLTRTSRCGESSPA